MGLAGTLISSIDGLGLRKTAARFASLTYGAATWGRQSFSVDDQGRWVNRQAEATIVSPNVHTTSYAAFRRWVIDNWCWGYLPKEGDTVIDVGAGVGEEAVIFSQLVGPTGRVISIEAQPAIFECLKATVDQSKLSNVVPLQIALSDSDGVVRIALGDVHLTSSIVKEDGGAEVPARSLDSLAAELGLGPIALLKMNIEGAERLAVRGMSRASANVQNLCISCHDFLADRGDSEMLRTKAEVKPLLEQYGFALRTRPDHRDAWVRDYLYGARKP